MSTTTPPTPPAETPPPAPAPAPAREAMSEPPAAPAPVVPAPAPISVAPVGGAASASADSAKPVGSNWLYRTLRVVCRIGATLFFDLKVYNAASVPPTGGVLVVCNHQSVLDPILIAVRVERPFSFLAKSELFENRYFGWLIRNLNAFPVRQGRGDKAAIEETIRRLREGHVLNVFPEGSRTEDGEIAPMQSGASLIVRRAEVPILPAVIDGPFRAWPKGKRWFRPTKVRVLYGQPVYVHHMKGAQITQYVDATLRRMFAELRAMERNER